MNFFTLLITSRGIPGVRLVCVIAELVHSMILFWLVFFVAQKIPKNFEETILSNPSSTAGGVLLTDS